MKLEWNWNWIRMKWEWNRNEVELICCSRWVVTARRRAFQCRHWPWIDFRFRFHFRSARICCGAIHFPVCRPPLPDSRPPLRSLTSNNNSPAPSVTFKSININPNQSQSIPISFSFLFFFLNIYCIGPDPRTWAREDVVTFLRWCEREFDLPGLDLEKFQMNGKTITTTTKTVTPSLDSFKNL